MADLGIKKDLGDLAVVIPAAGFGRRVGSPRAKELFTHPGYNRPLIEVAIQRAFQAGGRPVIVTREDKQELIDYCQGHSQKGLMDLVLIESSREWPDSVLQTKDCWRENNILLLPDTDFSPPQIMQQIYYSLNQVQTVWATHEVPDGRTWGCLREQGEKLLNCEKPPQEKSALAWGLIGFKKTVGEKLFNLLLQSTLDHHWFAHDLSYKLLSLQKFADLTRSGS